MLKIKEGWEKVHEFSGEKSEVVNKADSYELFIGDLSGIAKNNNNYSLKKATSRQPALCLIPRHSEDDS